MQHLAFWIIALLMPCSLAAKSKPLHAMGSSSVYNYASFVAESASVELGLKVVMEQTGTGAGILLFCNGGKDAPDIAMASRPITTSEQELCIKNGRFPIETTVIGRDALTLVSSKKHPIKRLTLEQLYKALASSQYSNWQQLTPSDSTPITIYGPSVHSGTREVIRDKIFAPYCKNATTSCYQVREDGAFIELGENYNLVIQKLLLDEERMGLVPYGYYLPYKQQLQAIEIDGVAPTEETISNSTYPLTRALYLYHLSAEQQSKPTSLWLEYWCNLPSLVRKHLDKLGLLSN